MLPSTPLNDRIGFALSRIVVPLWILMGVAFKLHAGTAANLPSNIVNMVRPYGPAAMDATLYTLIGLEIFAILVMVFIARLAQPMALFMLTVFCLILIGEMVKGADKCGCFGGTIDIEPWHMLVADGLLLLGVALFRPPMPEGPVFTPRAIGAAAAALIIGLVSSFAIGNALHDVAEPEQIVQDDDDPDVDVPRDPTINPAVRSVPRNWYPQNIPSWVGRPWREIEIFQFMSRWPEGLDEGKHYVVFYSRTCAHCEEMFDFDLTRPLGAPVVAIQIPTARSMWDIPGDVDPSVSFATLPSGPDWSLVTAPLALRVEDGIVTCAQEGDHKECFEIE